MFIKYLVTLFSNNINHYIFNSLKTDFCTIIFFIELHAKIIRFKNKTNLHFKQKIKKL